MLAYVPDSSIMIVAVVSLCWSCLQRMIESVKRKGNIIFTVHTSRNPTGLNSRLINKFTLHFVVLMKTSKQKMALLFFMHSL